MGQRMGFRQDAKYTMLEIEICRSRKGKEATQVTQTCIPEQYLGLPQKLKRMYAF